MFKRFFCQSQVFGKEKFAKVKISEIKWFKVFNFKQFK